MRRDVYFLLLAILSVLAVPQSAKAEPLSSDPRTAAARTRLANEPGTPVVCGKVCGSANWVC